MCTVKNKIAFSYTGFLAALLLTHLKGLVPLTQTRGLASLKNVAELEAGHLTLSYSTNTTVKKRYQIYFLFVFF